MSILMAGIDYRTAGVAQREPFSLSPQAVGQAVYAIKRQTHASGCVLLSTCNRTELYLSVEEGVPPPDPVHCLCDQLGLDGKAFAPYFTRREGSPAESHLMMVAAGLRSQLRGEDQILSQVKAAAEIAREAKATDPVLETLFRIAVSAGKRAKSEVLLAPVDSSVAHKAVHVLSHAVDLSGKGALVVGNGAMGRLAASLLAERGCKVTVTLRSFKAGISVVPPGCDAIPYDKRYEEMPSCDILISATTSPHYTISREEFEKLPHRPGLVMDLAVPRDIDPGIATLSGVRCWNVDTLGGNIPGPESAEKLRQIQRILGEYKLRYYRWNRYREQHLRKNA